jgi:hypothetical protein
MDKWTEDFEHRGVTYQAQFTRRPFREGLEVSVVVGEETLKIAELGLGTNAVISKLRARIDEFLGLGQSK